MTEVLFYHLTESKLEEALPALLEKSVERGWRVVLQTVGEERRDALDQHLWTYREESFLPHGTDQSAHPADQPVLLTVSPENANGGNIRFLVDGAEPPEIESYERVVFMFDGYDAAQLEGARSQWKRLKGGGHNLTYWQQASDGRWVKKA